MKGQRKKAFWAKKRVENAEKRLKEHEEVVQRRFRKPAFTPLKPRPSARVITDDMMRAASLPSAPMLPVSDPKQKPEKRMSDEEYIVREAKAQVEIERKKRMVAPIANKAGYQYIGDAPPEVIETLGRKV